MAKLWQEVFVNKAVSQKWRSKTNRPHDLEVARKPYSLKRQRALRKKPKHPTSKITILNIPITATSQKNGFSFLQQVGETLFWHKQGRVMLQQLQEQSSAHSCEFGLLQPFSPGRMKQEHKVQHWRGKQLQKMETQSTYWWQCCHRHNLASRQKCTNSWHINIQQKLWQSIKGEIPY